MSHDLQMMIYGALIGIGSSFITTLFQSWINRRDHEKQRKEEQKRENQKILIPTIDEVNAIKNSKYPRDKMPEDESSNRIDVAIITGLSPLLVSLLLLCGYIGYGVYLSNSPTFYLLAAWLITFAATYLFLKFMRKS